MSNPPPELVSAARCFGGMQRIFRHRSEMTGTDMRFAAFVPPQGEARKLPIVWFLAGLTCTEENFTVKAGAQRVAAELGLILIAADTSPRGEGVPGDPDGAYDFGLAQDFTSTPRSRLGHGTTGWRVTSCANCPTSWAAFCPPMSRGKRSWDTRWAGMAR